MPRLELEAQTLLRRASLPAGDGGDNLSLMYCFRSGVFGIWVFLVGGVPGGVFVRVFLDGGVPTRVSLGGGVDGRLLGGLLYNKLGSIVVLMGIGGGGMSFLSSASLKRREAVDAHEDAVGPEKRLDDASAFEDGTERRPLLPEDQVAAFRPKGSGVASVVLGFGTMTRTDLRFRLSLSSDLNTSQSSLLNVGRLAFLSALLL
jgi:hypothetical protein